MVAELFAGVSGSKAIFDIIKSLKDMNDAAVRMGAVIELQEKIFTAQAVHAAALERIRELEQENMHFKNWESEKDRYQLHKLEVGAYVYALKRSMSGGQPPHWLCTRCYEEQKKSILLHKFGTDSAQDLRMHMWRCPICSTTVRTRMLISPTFEETLGDENLE